MILCINRVLYALICIVTLGFNLYGQQSHNSEKGLNEDKESVMSVLRIADSLNFNKNFSDAETYYKKAFYLAKKSDNSKLITYTGLRLQNFLTYRVEKYESAERVLSFLLYNSKTKKDRDGVVKSHLGLGRLNKKKQNFIETLKHFNNALEEVEKTNNNFLYWDTYTARGDLIRTLGDLKQSCKDFKKALQYITVKTSDYDKSITYINISSSFDKAELDSTIYYAKLAAFNCETKTAKRRCNLANNNLAWAYHLKGNSKQALKLIKENIDLNKVIYNENDNLYEALMHTLGAIHYGMGNYKKAINYFKLSETCFIEKKNIVNIVQVKEDLSKVYESVGNLKASLSVLREIKPYVKVLDSLKISREVAKIESKKILEVKEKEISKLEKENLKRGSTINKTKIIIFCLIIFFSIVIVVLFFRSYKNKIRFHQLNEELSINRLKSLRSMMNPHFLFNSFSTLQNYILKKENLKANEYMAELSSLIRNVLSSSDSIYISFNDELQILKSYIEIEQERFSKSFTIDYIIDQVLVNENPVIPSMIIQPYVENAIIHGFSHLKKKGELTLSLKKEAHAVICKIQDNGIGRDKAEKIKKSNKGMNNLSIATRNTNERLRILSKVSHDTASVTIEDLLTMSGKANGTRVIVTLPIQKRDFKQ